MEPSRSMYPASQRIYDADPILLAPVFPQTSRRLLGMADPDYQLPGSLNRNSRYSHKSFAPSTHSWVHDPKIPPPQPINLPSPVQALRPLPDLHPRQNSHASHTRGPFYVVNTPGPSDFTVEHEHLPHDVGSYQPNQSTFDPNFGAIRPRKKKSFVGGFVKGIRKLPRTVFGYGAGMGVSEKKVKRRNTSEGTDMASTSLTAMSTGNTLPVYTSNPPTPVLLDPVHPGTSSHYRPQIAPIPESPLPTVVRLDDQKRHNPTFRVSPPRANNDYGEGFATTGTRLVDSHSTDMLYDNPVDRTTVMVYNDRETHYDRNSHGPVPPAPIVSRELSSPGLSYVSSEHRGSVRPLSFHSIRPTPIEIPQTASASSTRPRVSYTSQAPAPRATPPALIPGAVHSSSSSIHAHAPSETPQTVPALPTSQNAESAPLPVSDIIQSPVSVHPNPGADYLKMAHSPSPTSHGTITTGTSYYDPSFSSALNPVEKFFKTLYHMPWISHDRVTVDYHPGDGLGKMKKKKFRPATSWYQSMLSRSRRSSATLDLLTSGSTEASAHNSLRMTFGSPAGSRRGRMPSEKSRHKSHHQSSSNRHRHHSSSNDQHRRRKHLRATTMDNTQAKQRDLKPVISPLMPSMYPFPYPTYTPYPYPSFPSFPMPAYSPLSGQETTKPAQTQTQPTDDKGPSGEQQHQPLAMYAPAGYSLNSYQPMVGPQVYVLSSTPPKVETSILPSAPLTRGGMAEQERNNQQTKANQGQLQPMSNGHSGMVYMQPIPGAFS